MKYAITALFVIHGLIHVMGFAGAFRLAEFQGASRTPTDFVTADSGSPTLKVLGVVWIVALFAFLLAATLLLMDNPGWRPTAVAAVFISMVPIALWWQSAPMGAVANALVLAAVLVAPKLDGVGA